MPLQDQYIPVDFSGTLNTKTDPKKVVPGDFLLVQDGVFTQPSQIRKRNGYTKMSTAIENGGNLVAPRMIRSLNSELTCVDSSVFYSYSSNLSAWAPCGSMLSVDLLSNDSVYSQTTVNFVDSVTMGAFELIAYSAINYASITSGVGSNFVTVKDSTTDSFILPAQTLQGSGSGVTGVIKVAAFSATQGLVVYADGVTSLWANTITISGTSVTLSSPILIDNTGHGFVSLDVIPTPTGYAIAGISNSQVLAWTSTPAGVFSGATTIASSAGVTVALCLESFRSNIWVYWGGSSTGTFYQVYSSSFGTPGTLQTIDSTAAIQISPYATSTTTQNAYFVLASRTSPVGGPLNNTQLASGLTGSNNGTVTSVYNTIGIYSKVYVHPTYGPLALFVYPSLIQATYFLVALTNKLVIGRYAAGDAWEAEGPTGVTINISALPNTSLVFSAPKLVGQIADVNIGVATLEPLYGAFLWNFQFDTSRCYNTATCGEMLLINGSIINAYDGANVTEWGFNLFPEISSLTATGTGNIANGTYSYFAVYWWTDNNGNLHQSGVSNGMTITISNGPIAVAVVVSTLEITEKQNVFVQLYRTLNGGSAYFQVASTNFTTGGSTTITITDTLADTDAQNLPTLYTNGGVSDNSAAQPSMILESRFNRLWYVDAENPSVNEYYSKTFAPGYGLAPTDFNLTQIQPDGGDIIGLKAMDDKLVSFKEQAILWFNGDGANDAGTNSTLSVPQTIPTGSGLDNLGSLILIPSGIVYQTTKGLMLLDRGLATHYDDQVWKGASVEAYNNNVIWDATIIPNTTQVRFLTATGNTIVYDYLYMRFGIFTNHLGYSGDQWMDSYVYVRTDGSIYQENSTTFLDNTTPYALTVQTSWLTLGTIQGFERMRHLLHLGDQASTVAGHGIQVSAAYNFNPSFTAMNPYLFTNLTGSTSVFQNRVFMRQQKCDSISLLFTEVVTGTSGEYIDFTDLEFNCAVKKGLHKVSSAVSVG